MINGNILITCDIPEDCEYMEIEITCRTPNKDQIHVLSYDRKEISFRSNVYNILQKELKNLGIK